MGVWLCAKSTPSTSYKDIHALHPDQYLIWRQGLATAAANLQQSEEWAKDSLDVNYALDPHSRIHKASITLSLEEFKVWMDETINVLPCGFTSEHFMYYSGAGDTTTITPMHELFTYVIVDRVEVHGKIQMHFQ